MVPKIAGLGWRGAEAQSTHVLLHKSGNFRFAAFDPDGRVLHLHRLVDGKFTHESVIARGLITLLTLDLTIDFDQIECAESFAYPEKY